MKKGIKICIGLVGLALIVCGIICVISPLTAMSTVSTIIGIILLISAAGSALIFFVSGKFLIHSWLALVNAFMDAVAGILFCCYSDSFGPVLAVILGIMILIVAVIFIPVIPITKKMCSETEKDKAWLWTLAIDVLLFIIGIGAVKNAGTFGVALITVPVGIILIAIGIGYIVIAVNLLKNGSQSAFLKGSAKNDDTVIDVEYTDVD
jgi:uncharacterized membrane protein HdeD (DUF308 family)